MTTFAGGGGYPVPILHSHLARLSAVRRAPASQYLSDDCQLVTDVGRRHLRSSDVYTTCVVPRTQSRIGDRSFSVAGPRLWNNLPTEIRRDITFEHYGRLLKGFLFV